MGPPGLPATGGDGCRWNASNTGVPPGRRAPVLSALEIGSEGSVVIADTRRIARQRMTPLSRYANETLRHFEKPRREDSVDPGMRADLELLLNHRFVVRHDGHLVSVVTRPPKRDREPGPAPRPGQPAKAALTG